MPKVINNVKANGITIIHSYHFFLYFSSYLYQLNLTFVTNTSCRTDKLNMKSLIILLLAVIAFFLSSCNRKNNSALLPELVQAESLMYSHPDSALQILERMEVPSPSNRYQNATWCLLMTQARDKNYLKHTSDSLINIAYDYFKKQDDPQRIALAANYKGVVNGELNNTEQAIQCYLEASKEVEKTVDYRLAHLIFTNLGHIYLYRSLSDYAMHALQKAYYYAKLSEDRGYISYSLSHIARVYSIQPNWEKAIEYYKKAMVVAEKADEANAYSSALTELAGIYFYSKNYALALEYAKQALNIIKEERHLGVEQSELLIGVIYRAIGEKDSAAYYLNKAVISDNIRTVRTAYQALYLLSKDEKKYEKAIDYNDKLQIYSDSIQKSDRNREVVEMQEKYNQEKLLNEKHQLQIEKDYTVRIGLILLVFLICVIAVLVLNYQRKLLRKERTIQKNEEQIRLYTLRIHQNESLMSRNKSRMEELIVQIEENQGVQEQWKEQQNTLSEIQLQNEALQQENEKLQTNISHYSTSLQEKAEGLNTLKVLSDENLRLHDRERFLCNQLLKQSEVLNSLKKSPKYLDANGLSAMQEAVNGLYDNFTMRLSKQISSLTESDLQICCLIKLRLSNPEIATLIGISPSSVSKRKQRIKERVIQSNKNTLDDNQTLDLWFWEY